MNDATATPRTDAAITAALDGVGSMDISAFGAAEFLYKQAINVSRDLERELTAALAERDRALAEVKTRKDQLMLFHLDLGIARAKSDRLAAMLKVAEFELRQIAEGFANCEHVSAKWAEDALTKLRAMKETKP